MACLVFWGSYFEGFGSEGMISRRMTDCRGRFTCMERFPSADTFCERGGSCVFLASATKSFLSSGEMFLGDFLVGEGNVFQIR